MITLYFFRQNLLGIHESSDKALKIMIATTIMGLVILIWSGVTLATKGPATGAELAARPQQESRAERHGRTGPQDQSDHADARKIRSDSWGAFRPIAEPLRNSDRSWLSLIGLLGMVIAFGHSILAMSGEETLAQVYREVESPKLKNFKKAAFIVFVYSLLLTGTVSFLAVMLIPDERADGEVLRQLDRRPGDADGRPGFGSRCCSTRLWWWSAS